MLGRLFKHEMKHAAPFFLLLYGIFLAVTALARVGMELMERYEVLRFPSMLLFIGYVVGIMVVFLFPGFYAVIRFYRNLTGPQGYLMFALPVRTCSHVWVSCSAPCCGSWLRASSSACRCWKWRLAAR